MTAATSHDLNEPASAVNIEPPTKPTLLDRIGSIFAREKQTHRQAYITLLRKSATRELSVKEIDQLHQTMRGAGINLEELAEHQRLLESLPLARAAANKEIEARDALAAAYTAAEEFDKIELAPILEKQARLRQAIVDAASATRSTAGAAAELVEVERRHAEVFGA